MEFETKASIVLGTITTIIFTAASIAIKNTELIWLQTRFFGLLSYLFLFLTVVIGELRVLRKIKGDFLLFRFHKPVAIFSLFLVFVHGFSAMVDNFKWGKNLAFTQFLGFSFGDKWLVLLSFGTLAFYLMILVSFTSSKKIIRKIGYKNWKKVHYFSYVLFVIAFIHSVGLGTDIKTSFVAPVISPIIYLSFLFVVSLFLSRFAKEVFNLDNQAEINFVSVLFLLLILGLFFATQLFVWIEGDIELSSQNLGSARKELLALDQQITVTKSLNNNLTAEIEGLKNG